MSHSAHLKSHLCTVPLIHESENMLGNMRLIYSYIMDMKGEEWSFPLHYRSILTFCS